MLERMAAGVDEDDPSPLDRRPDIAPGDPRATRGDPMTDETERAAEAGLAIAVMIRAIARDDMGPYEAGFLRNARDWEEWAREESGGQRAVEGDRGPERARV